MPIPRTVPADSSPTIAPTTAAVAARRNPVNISGSAVGMRRYSSVLVSLAAYERISSTSDGAAERSPRSVLTVIGKKARYAEIAATRGPRRQVGLASPDDDHRGDGDERHGLRRDDPRRQTPAQRGEAEQQQGEPEADDEGDRQPGGGGDQRAAAPS